MKANHILGHISKSTTRWLRVAIISFYVALMKPHLKYLVQTKCYKTGEPSGEPQDGPGHGHRERLQELGLLSLELRRPKGHGVWGCYQQSSLPHGGVVKTQ